MSATKKKIGVLAIQGDYSAHAQALIESGAEAIEIRKPEELAHTDALILPGGESTTMLKFLERGNFLNALKEFASEKPVFGTCAGAILLAREVLHPPQASLGLLDAIVERNAYGRQIDSSILTVPTELGPEPLEMVFIRAPRIVETGPEVEVLARRDGFPSSSARAASSPQPSIPSYRLSAASTSFSSTPSSTTLAKLVVPTHRAPYVFAALGGNHHLHPASPRPTGAP